VEQRRDPFGPVAARDAQARAREVVLWESPQAMVLVDLFSAYPKALVVPKQRVMFPTEAPAALLDELARVSAHVSDAFVALGAAESARIWINPPHDLTVRQLHIHVMPALGNWRAFLALPPAPGRRERAVDVMKQAKSQMQQVFAQLTKVLEANLGPST
jgi:diadenosine tetraphosphate (Ap4A) HIT family hydrolase